jgi:hypothetical protein
MPSSTLSVPLTACRRISKGQVRNIDGHDITAQARFIANLFDVVV